MIIIESKRKKSETIMEKYPDAILADVTNGAKDGHMNLSTFYPHRETSLLSKRVVQPLAWRPYSRT